VAEKKSRRGHNEGSIYRTADGTWRGAAFLGVSPEGKPIRKYVTGKTKAETLGKVKKILADHERGIPIARKDQTVAEFFDRWLEDVVRVNKRPRTYEAYESLVRVHIIPSIGRHKLNKLTAQHIQQMLTAKQDEGLAGRTLINIRAIVRAALNQAMRWDLIGRNVATLTDAPQPDEFEAKPLSPAEVTAFLKQVKDDRLAALYVVTVWLGLRQGEVFGLRWQDVDLDSEDAELRIVYQLQYRKVDSITDRQLRAMSEHDQERVKEVRDANEHHKLPFLVSVKTEKSRRALPLPAPVVNALKLHRDAQKIERALAGRHWKGDGWDLVFCSTVGTPLDSSNVTKQYKAHLETAKLGDRRFHDLRHSCGTFLASRNVHPRIAMDILGHSQIATTMNTYTHVDMAMRREALNAISDVFEEQNAAS